MGFGERLSKARASRELTGEALGRKLGVSKATISHWEKDRYQPDLQQLHDLSIELGVSVDYLLGLEKIELPPDAIREARLYAKLSAEDKRRWKTLRMTLFSTVE